MKKIIYALKTPFLLTVTFMIICGIGYPLLVTGLGQTLFFSSIFSFSAAV